MRGRSWTKKPKWLSASSGTAMISSLQTTEDSGLETDLSSPPASVSCPLWSAMNPAPNQVNRRVTLAARPDGYPTEADFKLVEGPVPSIGPGQVLVKTRYLSLDPYMRGRMNAAKSYAPPVEIGATMV